jgi:hypothetical protein
VQRERHVRDACAYTDRGATAAATQPWLRGFVLAEDLALVLVPAEAKRITCQCGGIQSDRALGRHLVRQARGARERLVDSDF